MVPAAAGGAKHLRRIARLIRWTLREPAQWRVAFLLFLVVLFAATSSVVHSGCGGTFGACSSPPEEYVGLALDFTATRVVGAAYPFVFPVVSVLVTLGIVVQRERGDFATLQALGFRRSEILIAQSLAIFLLALVPSLIAFLLLPPFVEPRLLTSGNFLAMYQPRYWASMPRLFLAILFTVLFASAFAMAFRRASIAFGAMIAFFFFGWYLQIPLGLQYGILTPPGSFTAAYSFYRPLPGIAFDPNYIFVLYLLAGLVAFVGALAYASRRGELQ
jgi:hypothetical protein